MVDPTVIGTASEAEGSGAQTTVITTTVAVAVGDIILVGAQSGKTFSSVVDSSGAHTYTQDVMAAGSARVVIYRAVCTTPLAIGATITITTGGLGASAVNAYALKQPGAKNAVDASNTATGASGEPSIGIDPVAPTTTQFAFVGQGTNAVSGTAVDDPEWTSFGAALVHGATSLTLFGAWKKRTDGAADSYDPTTDLNVAWQAGALSLAPVANDSSLLTLGVS